MKSWLPKPTSSRATTAVAEFDVEAETELATFFGAFAEEVVARLAFAFFTGAGVGDAADVVAFFMMSVFGFLCVLAPALIAGQARLRR